MATRDELTKLAVELSGLKARVEILELMSVKDLLEMAYAAVIFDIREFMQAERDNLLEHAGTDEREE